MLRKINFHTRRDKGVGKVALKCRDALFECSLKSNFNSIVILTVANCLYIVKYDDEQESIKT